MAGQAVRGIGLDLGEGGGRTQGMDAGGRDQQPDHRATLFKMPFGEHDGTPRVALMFAGDLDAGETP